MGLILLFVVILFVVLVAACCLFGGLIFGCGWLFVGIDYVLVLLL